MTSPEPTAAGTRIRLLASMVALGAGAAAIVVAILLLKTVLG
jgi:hypothetical protein